MRMTTPYLVLAGTLCLVATVSAQDQQGGEAEMAAMMAEMMRYAAPGEHHQHLDAMAGQWNFTTKFRMSPSAEWQPSQGTAACDWVLGGRFLQQRIQSPPSAAMPMDFEGLGLIGYDNFAQEYIHLWMDNFFTGAIVFRGQCTDAGHTITLSGEFTKPMTGAQKIKARWVYKIKNQDHFTLEMWEPDADGQEYLHGEIAYQRTP